MLLSLLIFTLVFASLPNKTRCRFKTSFSLRVGRCAGVECRPQKRSFAAVMAGWVPISVPTIHFRGTSFIRSPQTIFNFHFVLIVQLIDSARLNWDILGSLFYQLPSLTVKHAGVVSTTRAAVATVSESASDASVSRLLKRLKSTYELEA